MQQPHSYRWPFIFSLLLHAVLFGFFMINLNNATNYTTSEKSGESQNNAVIHAIAINPKQIKQKQQQQRIQELEKPVPKPPEKKETKIEAKIKESAVIPDPPVKASTKPTHYPVHESIPTPAPMPVPKLAVPPEKKPAPAKNIVDPKLKRAMEHDLQKQLAEESMEQGEASVAPSKTIETNPPNAAHVQGEVDKYKALIVQAISQHWLIPDDVRQDLSCELLIRVDAGGDVLSVTVVRSSGNAILDRSARAAVFKATPLPVPKEAEVFDKFRELRLTVRPENVM